MRIDSSRPSYRYLLGPGLCLAAAGLWGCNSILGTGDYVIVEAAGGTPTTSSGTGGTGGTGAACTANTECLAQSGGLPAVCRKSDHTCITLTSKDCTRFIGEQKDLESDDTIVLGSLLPTIGPDESYGVPTENSISLTQSEFAGFKGLPPASPDGARRALVFMACNHADDAIRAAQHLVDIEVPAIIGPAFSGVTINVANTVTIDAGVLLMSPSATSTLITDLQDKNLVWRTSPPDSLQAKAIAGLVSTELEKKVRTELALSPSDPIKLGVVFKNDGYGQGLNESLFTELKFNGGKTAAQNGTNFQTVTYGNPDEPDPPPDYAKAQTAMLGFKPHIMIVVAISEGISDILIPIEDQWTEQTYRPRYIFTDGGQIPELVRAIGNNSELRGRVLGTAPGTTGNLFDLYKTKYLAEFTDGTSPEVFGAAGAYDATYLLGYAITALGDKPVTGTSIAQGLAKTITGTKVDTGPSGISKAFTTLGAGEGIDFTGASGPLDFDLKTGEAESNIQIWCFAVQGTTATGFANSGLFFDATVGALSGALDCP